MNNTELAEYLEKRRANCEKAKAKNIAQTHGLGDYTKPVTEQGKINDAFLRGKIEIIDAVLEKLNDQKTDQEQPTKPRTHIDFLKAEIKAKKEQAEALAEEIAELEAELAEKIGYQTLDDLGIPY